MPPYPRPRIEVALGNSWKLLRGLGELSLVAIQHFAEGRSWSRVMHNTIPLLVPSEFGEESYVLQQFVALGRRK
jgi:hypothetical protein